MTAPAAVGIERHRRGPLELGGPQRRVNSKVNHGRSRVVRSRWRMVVALAGLCAISSVLTSCSPTPELGFRLAPDGQRVEVLVNPCKDLRMHQIVVAKWPASGQDGYTVWEVSSPQGSQMSRAIIGEAPRGFATMTALRRPLEPDTTYGVRFGEGDSSVGHFKPRELRRSVVLYKGSYVTERQYRKQAADACIVPPDWNALVVWAVSIVLFGVALAAFSVGVALVIRKLANRSGNTLPPERPKQTLPPPPLPQPPLPPPPLPHPPPPRSSSP